MTDPGRQGSDRLGRADLHIHTLASDGTSSISEILDVVEARDDLDVIAITDHERIDAAVAARAIARARGLRTEIVVGEEITTRSGHLLGLFLHEPVRPLLSLRESIRRIHAQGGLAIPAHPLVPIPLCVSARAIRSLLADPDPQVRPDAIEAFNPTSAGRPWRPRIHAFLDETGIAAVGNSDAHVATAIGTGWTTFPGRTAEDLRHAILTGTTRAHGTYYGRAETVRTFGRQLRKYSRDIRDEVRGTLRGRRTGRDLGYPGGHLRPARFEPPVEAVER